MEPFSIPDPLKSLTDPYPPPRLVLDVAGRGGETARIAIARLWLSEGIPYAFRKCPAVYESLRSWLSVILGVHAKEIGVVGSARIGKSISPGKLGKQFSAASDLDLVIVSKGLFETLREEFCQWLLAFESGRITAKNDKEQKHWKDNSRRVPKNITAGFLDPKFIPNHQPYPMTRRIDESLFLLAGKLKRTPNAPKPRKASVQCFESWDSFVRQKSLNLRACWEDMEKTRHERNVR